MRSGGALGMHKPAVAFGEGGVGSAVQAGARLERGEARRAV